MYIGISHMKDCSGWLYNLRLDIVYIKCMLYCLLLSQFLHSILLYCLLNPHFSSTLLYYLIWVHIFLLSTLLALASTSSQLCFIVWSGFILFLPLLYCVVWSTFFLLPTHLNFAGLSLCTHIICAQCEGWLTLLYCHLDIFLLLTLLALACAPISSVHSVKVG